MSLVGDQQLESWNREGDEATNLSHIKEMEGERENGDTELIDALAISLNLFRVARF